MSTKDRAVDNGTRRGRTILTELGNELRASRLEHGLSQAAVAAAARISRAQVSRIERAEAPRVAILELARVLAVVGLELSARAYPSGRPIRDAAHLALLARFRQKVAPSIAWRFEAPVGGTGDLRAWDAVMLVGLTEVAVETETRPRDVQALLRRLATKRRDDPGISSVVLVMADARHNRSLLKEFGEVVRSELPLTSKAIIEALAVGRWARARRQRPRAGVIAVGGARPMRAGRRSARPMRAGRRRRGRRARDRAASRRADLAAGRYASGVIAGAEESK